jgi:hypothetical protein
MALIFLFLGIGFAKAHDVIKVAGKRPLQLFDTDSERITCVNSCRVLTGVQMFANTRLQTGWN